MLNLKHLLLMLSLFFSNTFSLYIATAADAQYFPHLMNFIGCLHKINFNELSELVVFDLGLTIKQKQHLTKISKTKVFDIEKVSEDILKPFKVNHYGKIVPGWYSWKPVAIKQALDRYPHVLWLDAGSTILKSLNPLNNYICKNGYFLCTIGDEIDKQGNPLHTVEHQSINLIKQKFNLNIPENNHILKSESIAAGIIGVTRQAKHLFIDELYELAKDIKNFEDDGTALGGFGAARYEQALLSIIAYSKKLIVFKQDYKQLMPMLFYNEGIIDEFFITWNKAYVNEKTCIYSSRWDLGNDNQNHTYINYL